MLNIRADLNIWLENILLKDISNINVESACLAFDICGLYDRFYNAEQKA